MKKRLLTILDKLSVPLLLWGVFIANLLDATLTLIWIDSGIATEANPIMNYLLQLGKEWFFTGKILAVSISCLILLHLQKLRLTKLVSLFACLMYIGIITFHVLGAKNVGVSFLNCLF
jgi:hypothetical protein